MTPLRSPRLPRRLTRTATLASVGFSLALLGACSGGHPAGTGQPAQRLTGQADFVSAPQLGGTSSTVGVGGGFGSAGTAAVPASNAGASASTPSTSRAVQETDL